MILNEQKITRQGRTYYHGTKFDSLDQDKAHWSYIFISTNLFYSIDYCRLTFNNYKFVYEVYIKKPLNIFNAKSKIDLTKLLKQLDLNESNIIELQNNDWTRLNFIKRDDLVKIIKSLNYDGFFNFEFDNFNPEEIDSPSFKRGSLGIFDIDNLNFSKKLTFKDFLQNKEFKSYYEKDIKSLDSLIKRYVIEDELQYNYSLEEFLYTSCSVLPQEEIEKRKKEINDIFEKYDSQKFELQELNEQKEKEIGKFLSERYSHKIDYSFEKVYKESKLQERLELYKRNRNER